MLGIIIMVIIFAALFGGRPLYRRYHAPRRFGPFGMGGFFGRPMNFGPRPGGFSAPPHGGFGGPRPGGFGGPRPGGMGGHMGGGGFSRGGGAGRR